MKRKRFFHLGIEDFSSVHKEPRGGWGRIIMCLQPQQVYEHVASVSDGHFCDLAALAFLGIRVYID